MAEEIEYDADVIVVGAGFAGCVAAYTLAQAGKAVLMIERGNYAGSKNMTGGRFYSHSLKKVFPNFEKEAPIERKVTHEKISLMTAESNFTVDFTSPKLGEEGQDSYTVLRGPFDQWLAEQAENAGVECIYGIRVDSLIVNDGKVQGVVAGDDELHAPIVILADGVNSLLAQQLGFLPEPSPSQMAVGAKEVIELGEDVINDRFNLAPGEGAAWLFAGDATAGRIGGGIIYTNKTSVSLGVVATLGDTPKGDVSVPQMVENLKNHPAVAPLIEGGKTIEYSGHMVPEGGYNMLPKMVGNGVLVTGDAAMLCINLGYLVRGMDFAVASGQMAAEAAIEALDAEDYSEAKLSSYKTKMENSFVMRDIKAVQKWPETMEGFGRMFSQYPSMIEKIMLSMFVVDGKTEATPLKQKLMGPVKEIGLFSILGDVRKAVKAL